MKLFIFRFGRRLGAYPRGVIRTQINSFIHMMGWAANRLDLRHKEKPRTQVSKKTRVDRKQSLKRTAIDLTIVAPHLTHICDITAEDVYRLLDVWIGRGVGVSFVKNNLGYLRTLLWFALLPSYDVEPSLAAIKAAIDAVVPTNALALMYMGLPTRRKYTDNKKAWELFRLDPVQVILDEVYPVDPTIGTVLLLCVVFGFRLKEGMLFDVMESLLPHGAGVRVLRGAKTGRKRDVKVKLGATERRVLALARIHRNAVTGTLVPGKGGLKDRDLMKFRRRIYRLMERLGLTQKARGVTIHGLRHSAACRWFKELTGVDAPIMGGPAIDAALDAEVRAIIAQRLGHCRLSVVSVYCGSPRTYRAGKALAA